MIKSTFLGATVLACAFQAAGEPVSSTAWTPETLARQALAANSELKSYEAEWAAAQGLRTQAGLWRNPEIGGEYGRRRVSGESGGSQEEGFTRSASLTQTFEFPGKGSLRKAIADKDVEIARAGLEHFRLTLAGKVRLLALRHRAAALEEAAAGENAARGQALIELLRKRPNAGATQMLELRLLEASVFDLKKQALETARARDETRLELAALLGLPASQTFSFAFALESPTQALDSEKAVFAGLTHNFLLKSRILELEKAVRTVTAARMEPLPDFAVGPFFSQDRAGGNEENLGVAFSATLPLWNWNQGNVAAAQARREQADALLLEARRQVEREILRRIRDYRLHRKLAEELSADASAAFQESADLADRHYRLGAISTQLYLETQKEYLNLLRLRHETVLEAWKNLLDLEWLTGGKLESPR